MIKKLTLVCSGLLCGAPAMADDIHGIDKLLCASNRAALCTEDGDCFDIPPTEIDIPKFVIIDTKKKTVSTTRGSGENRSTVASSLVRSDDLIILQGIENGRAFNFVIEEHSGALSAGVVHQGLTVSVFGNCTDADID